MESGPSVGGRATLFPAREGGLKTDEKRIPLSRLRRSSCAERPAENGRAASAGSASSATGISREEPSPDKPAAARGGTTFASFSRYRPIAVAADGITRRLPTFDDLLAV